MGWPDLANVTQINGLSEAHLKGLLQVFRSGGAFRPQQQEQRPNSSNANLADVRFRLGPGALDPVRIMRKCFESTKDSVGVRRDSFADNLKAALVTFMLKFS